MSYIIEKMKNSDIDEVLALEEKCFSLPWTRQMFCEELKNDAAHYIVIRSDEKIVAYGGYWHSVDQADITNVAVDPDYRREGLGSKVMSYMIDEAKQLGVCNMALEVRKSNDAAIALYEKHGFLAVGVRKRYYSDNGEDAIIMIKEW